MSDNNVDHPSHYNTFGPLDDDGTAKYEPIKVIEAWGMGPEFCVGNALKYIARAPHKGKPIEDLKKARWYLERVGDGHPIEMTSGTFVLDVVEAWGMNENLRVALLRIKHGRAVKAAHYIDREIGRLTREDS